MCILIRTSVSQMQGPSTASDPSLHQRVPLYCRSEKGSSRRNSEDKPKAALFSVSLPGPPRCFRPGPTLWPPGFLSRQCATRMHMRRAGQPDAHEATRGTSPRLQRQHVCQPGTVPLQVKGLCQFQTNVNYETVASLGKERVLDLKGHALVF